MPSVGVEWRGAESGLKGGLVRGLPLVDIYFRPKMAGFGEQKSSKKKKKTTPERKSQIGGDTLYKRAINHHAQGDLVNAEKDYREAIKAGYFYYNIFLNLGAICQNSWRSDEAISLYKKAIGINPDVPDAYSNLGNLYKELCDLKQALGYTLKSLELKPDNPDALMTLGGIYQDLGQPDQALTSTLKSLELKPDNHTALMNLGSIYKDLGNLDQALASTLQSLEIKPDNPAAAKNISGFIDQLNLSPSNVQNATRAYELLLNRTDISHRKLTKMFLQAFLPTIQKASATDPIICDGNEALKH